MKLRAAACGTAVLVLGLLAIGPAAAQPYPPYGPPYGPPPVYGPYGPPPVYAAPRHVPAYPASPELADDELPPEEIPGGASPRVSGPYPVSPAEPSPYTGSVPAAGPEYPPPYRAAPSAAYPPGPPPAPSAAYPPGPAPAPSGPPAAGDARYGAPDGVLRPPVEIDPAQRQAIAALPPEEQPEAQPKELPPQLRRQLADLATKEPAGTIIIDTPNTYLYLVMGHGKAMRYGIGVGRQGFTWAGVERVSKMTEWPDWYPPDEMIDRQPYLPRMMAGGPGNPLGARALYLGKSLYRIHGTNQPSTIGQFVSSGCIRLLNEDIEDLYGRVTLGTRVVVWPGSAPGPSASAQPPVSPPPGPPSVR
ncbi:MAG: L,D-transpeptidase [Alphaproteobacteria bacterium]|nr:MAG: L,D-transpeptidase [Alphaproteobacteria bacterium]